VRLLQAGSVVGRKFARRLLDHLEGNSPTPEQLIYKWRNTRRVMGPILAHAYRLLGQDGRSLTLEEMRGHVERLFRGNFPRWTQSRA
jgi:hypothetical protein